MRRLLAIIIVAFLAARAPAWAADCGTAGDAKNARAAALNEQKNRDSGLGAIDPRATLAAILAPGKDLTRWSVNNSASVTGYVANVIPGGIESCNCHARAVADRDTHIYVVATKADAGHLSRSMIIEVTPRIRQEMSAIGQDWSTQALRALIGKIVTFRGALFFDDEHKQNSVNTNPSNKKDWRATAWEIHPAVAIKVEP